MFENSDDKKLISRWDSERELLRRHRRPTRTTKYKKDKNKQL